MNIYPYLEKPRDWPYEVSATCIASFACKVLIPADLSLKDEERLKLFDKFILFPHLREEDFLFEFIKGGQ